MILTVLGIDPGAEEAHAVLIAGELGPGALKANLQGQWQGGQTPLTLITKILSDAADAGIHVVAIEVARGEIHSGRAADGILRNNIMAGRLAGHFEAHQLPVLLVPAGGTTTAWSWRHELGAGTTDAGVAHAVRRHLIGELPTGSRGGHNSHYHDAAGAALATWRRAQRLHWTPGMPLTELDKATALEAAIAERRATTRRVRRAARRVTK